MAADVTVSDRDAAAAAALSELDDITAKLRDVPTLYERRVELYQVLRALDPPVPYDVIAEHTDAGSEAVRVAVNKAKREAQGNPISRRNRNTT